MAVIDADPYIPGGGGAQWFINQNNFFRSVRNFIIDLRQMPASASATGLHWQVSQATSLCNVVVEMSTASGNNHQGIWMENGSGGFMSDLTFNGGKFGMWVGNQQFTVRNVTVNKANTAVFAIWNWGWTFQGITINNCQVGFDLATGGTTKENQGVGAEAIIDAVVTNTPVFVRSSKPTKSLSGSLVLNNIHLKNVPTAVGVVGGEVVLKGGTTVIECWAQGNVFHGTSSTPKFVQDHITAPTKAPSLLDSEGRIFGRARPQYENVPLSKFVSVKDQGAKGDGHTDDTVALNNMFDKFANTDMVIFFDAGTYLVTSTIHIPPNVRIVGEVWSTIMGAGDFFSDMGSPRPVVRVGESGNRGYAEISDMMFTTRGPAAGAIVVEWNIASDEKGEAGMWDSHIRLGGAAGSNLQQAQCPKGQTSDACFAAFLGLHLTYTSNAYLEGTWVWLADHDLDGTEQITAFSGRGISSQSQGPVWMIGTGSEHHVLYQYSLVGARDHYMGLIQTESPYYQPEPAAPAPFTINQWYKDPSMEGQTSSWALEVRQSHNIFVFGAGLYSFFSDYKQSCIDSNSCQVQVLNIDKESTISVFSLSTVGATQQLSVDSRGVVPASANPNGFQSTMTAWLREGGE